MVVAAVVTVVGVQYNSIHDSYYVAERDGVVEIMRGRPGSFLGFSANEPHQVACLQEVGPIVKFIGANDSRVRCDLLTVDVLQESAAAQVRAGLPVGTETQAQQTVTRLALSSLLPLCADAAPTSSAPPPQTTTAPPSTTVIGGDVTVTLTPEPTPTAPSLTPTTLKPAPPSQEPGVSCRAA